MDRREFLKSAGAVAVSATAIRRSMAQDEPHPVVRTTAGSVRGAVHDGVSVFLEIPYGGNTRERRFQTAVPPSSWSGVRDALAWGDRAPQLGGNGMTSRSRQVRASGEENYHLPPDEGAVSEDCLHVNVWTPSPSARGHERRPVLFYIHGGAYNGGTVNRAV